MADMKYTAKDSVFSFIFRQPENTRRLYLTLHPEDIDVTEADCKLVTLEHILTNGMTNDLGFQVRDKLILLVEAQSKFSIEELKEGIDFVHQHGKKIYLTVNTLVKEREFSFLYEYLSPLYEAGLDGVIIQDLGVWKYIRETFPGMALHASTQMTITGSYGTSFLKEIGASRIVSDRELYMVEIC